MRKKVSASKVAPRADILWFNQYSSAWNRLKSVMRFTGASGSAGTRRSERMRRLLAAVAEGDQHWPIMKVSLNNCVRLLACQNRKQPNMVVVL